MVSLPKLSGKEDRFCTLLEASDEEARCGVLALVKLSKALDRPVAVDEFAYARRKDAQITRVISDYWRKPWTVAGTPAMSSRISL